MAIQTLNTIKDWFRTGLKPTQAQFWDTWDSFRHKNEKIDVNHVEGITELIEETISETLNINGQPDRLTKIELDSEGEINLTQSNITDTGDLVIINSGTEIDSQLKGESGLRFTNLKNEPTITNEIVYDQDVRPTAGIDETVYFPYGDTVKKVNPDNTVIDYCTFPEGFSIQGKILVSAAGGDLFLICFDGVSLYYLVKFDQSGIISVLYSSDKYYECIAIDINNNFYINEYNTTKLYRLNESESDISEYYNGDLELSALGFDNDLNGYFSCYDSNVLYKIDSNGTISNLATLNFEIRTGCVKPDGSLYILSQNYDDQNVYLVDNSGNCTVFASFSYTPMHPCLAQNGFLYLNNHDYDNGLIYQVSPKGQVTTFYSGGNSPRDMAVTSSGIVYVSHSASYNLIKITSQEKEQLLTLDQEGNVKLSDKEFVSKSDISGTANTISKFNTSGDGVQDSSITDDGSKVLISEPLEIDSKSPGLSGLKFTNLNNNVAASGPIDINIGITGYMNGSVIDSQGNIYVYQESEGTGIYKINSFTNTVTHIISLPASTKSLKIANSDNIYFAYYIYDGESYTNVGRITPDGNIVDVALRIPGNYQRMILDPDTEDLFLTRYVSETTIKVTAAGVVSDFVLPSTVAQGSSIYSGAVDHDHNLILGTNNGEIIKVEPDGTPSLLATLDSPASPRAMIIDKNNTIYTANYYSDNIAVIASNGNTNFIGNIGYDNAELAMDNDGNFLTVAHSERKLYLTTPDGVSIIIGDTAQYPRLPVVNSENEIFVANYNAGLQKYTMSKKRLLTLDEEGNVVKSDEDISQKWVQSWVPNFINTQTPIVISNSNGSALTASQLNSYYPRAVIGTRVQCMNIYPGEPIIYEKTISGWASYQVILMR